MDEQDTLTSQEEQDMKEPSQEQEEMVESSQKGEAMEEQSQPTLTPSTPEPAPPKVRFYTVS